MAPQIVYDIELGGAPRRLNFGMVCWEFFCEKMNVGPSDILPTFTGSTSFRAMRTLVHSAMAAEDYLKGIPTTTTEREIAGWLNEDAEKITEVFMIAVKVLAPEGEPQPLDKPVKVGDQSKKKRSPSKRSKK